MIRPLVLPRGSSKFYTWTDNKGNLETALTKDELLTNLTIYWATQTIHSAIRLYYEVMQQFMEHSKLKLLAKLNPFDKTGDKVAVPTAIALFPKDISDPPKEFAERFFNVQRWTKMKSGGHFAAIEEPELLSNDIREFVASLIGKNKKIK